MASNAVVADTYALIEIVNGNEQYRHYTAINLVTSDFVLAEFHYHLLRKYGRTTARQLFTLFSKRSRNPGHTVIRAAAEYRFANKDASMSYTDCVGYTMAQALGIPFLTGDKAFKGKPGVLWVQ
jgi:predicted nucleic acid-binding protein